MVRSRDQEALVEFFNAMSKDERDLFRRRSFRRVSRGVRRAVRRRSFRRVGRHIRRASRRVGRHVRRAVGAAVNFVGDQQKIMEIARALKRLISKGLDFAGFNFRRDARELAAIIHERSQEKLETLLVNFVAKVSHENLNIDPLNNILLRTSARRCLKKYQRLAKLSCCCEPKRRGRQE